MFPLLCNIALTIIWGMLLLSNPSLKNGKLVFCAIVCVQWSLLAGLRSETVGADTTQYHYIFDRWLLISPTEAINSFFEEISQGLYTKDWGYFLFLVVPFQQFSSDYRVFLLFDAAVFYILLSRFIYKWSENPILSYLIYSCVFYASFPFTLQRQSLALAFAVFLGYEFIVKRKPFAFVAIVLFAASMHRSVLLFLPFYWLARKQLTAKYITFIFIAFAFMFAFNDRIMGLAAILLGYDNYVDSYVGRNTIIYAFVLAIVAMVAISKQKRLSENPTSLACTNACLVAFLFMPLAFVNSNAFRAVNYYMFFLLFLVPSLISAFSYGDKKMKTVITMAVGAVLIAFFILVQPVSQTVRYLFFWEG